MLIFPHTPSSTKYYQEEKALDSTRNQHEYIANYGISSIRHVTARKITRDREELRASESERKTRGALTFDWFYCYLDTCTTVVERTAGTVGTPISRRLPQQFAQLQH